jgi:hypothetical protein
MRAPPVAEKHTSGMRSTREFGAAREFLADDRTHRAAHEREVERAGDDRLRLQRAAHRHERVLLACLLLRGDEAILVLLGVAELERVDRFQIREQFLRAAGVEERVEPSARGSHDGGRILGRP